jgi:hypothetical protein
MTPEQFAYWLQGFVELGKGAAPTPEQWKSIREHLETVFKKVTPPVGVEQKNAATELQRFFREYDKKLADEGAPKDLTFYPPQPTPAWPPAGHGYTITC